MIRKNLLVGVRLGLNRFAAPIYSQTPPQVAVCSGRMFDSKTGQFLAKQVVLIQGERIVEVGSEDQVKIPAGAQVIDLSQATVLPGLIDMDTQVQGTLSAGRRVNSSKEAWTQVE